MQFKLKSIIKACWTSNLSIKFLLKMLVTKNGCYWIFIQIRSIPKSLTLYSGIGLLACFFRFLLLRLFKLLVLLSVPEFLDPERLGLGCRSDSSSSDVSYLWLDEFFFFFLEPLLIRHNVSSRYKIPCPLGKLAESTPNWK